MGSYVLLTALKPQWHQKANDATKQNSIHQQCIDNNTTEELHSITTTSDNKVLTITNQQ
jgi:hypothetical protein